MTLDDLVIQRDATSMHQSAEWGMHSIQSSFPRIKDRIPFKERGEQKVTMNIQPEGTKSWNESDLECVHAVFAYKCDLTLCLFYK